MNPPKLARNVYRDLRDRRMLSIAIVLVVAIAAVPILGKSGAADTAPPPVSAAAAPAAPFAAPEQQLEPIVVADVPGLRNFHERLASYRSHNPFKQQLVGSSGDGSGGGGGGNGGGSGSTGSGASGGGGSGSAPTPDASVSSSPTPSSPTSGPSSPSPAPSNPAPEPPAPAPAPAAPPAPPSDSGDQPEGSGKDGTAELITYRLDVRTGPVGKTRVSRDVKPLALLSDRQHPLVQYVESNAAGNAAAFVVGADATATRGGGKCAPTPQRCRFLLMKADDDMYFRYEPDGLTYRLQLRSIDEHREPADPPKLSLIHI